MKNVHYFGLILFSLLVFTACSSSSPGEAAKKYAEYFNSGKYEKFVEGIAIPEDDSVTKEQLDFQKQMLISTMKEKGEKALQEQGGVKSIEILSEEIEDDGKTATVILKQTYGNGEVQENTYDMVKQNGTWKIALNK